MISRSLLLVLLVLACLPSFTSARTGYGPAQCCGRFQTRPIPVRDITAYKETDPECLKPGVIFTLQNGLQVCADLGIRFSLPDVDGPDQCCFNFLTRPIPVRVITAYEKTHPQCLKPGVLFTIQNSHHVCADLQVEWVKDHMKKLYQRPFSSLTNTEDGDGLDRCCFRFQTRPISVRVITDYKETDPKCSKPGVIFTRQDGRRFCADPQDMWVNNRMNRIGKRLFNSLNKPEFVGGPDQCCFSFQTRPIPVRVITAYEETDPKCTKPGVIFTLQDGRRLCADPKYKWVKINKNTIDQRKTD
ncbi:uncharacterized protein LOC132849130 isoform X2 [Tachysurus vachellii]|uniref:uncharacterized protein LOC132849130 isoform X2 n=1 Tax=Tachysurus vachellii TaxID=175792 RepID=UPI00296AA65C|nr:uncharacterized protein LOC132849130 isoform X2 [Tachysurus vachellii]